jgi:hypothetical protein
VFLFLIALLFILALNICDIINNEITNELFIKIACTFGIIFIAVLIIIFITIKNKKL